MSEPQSPLASPRPWDLVASDYTAEVVPVFEAFAANALELAGVGERSRVVDVAAGPGTLSVLAARRGAHVAALDFSPRMIDALYGRVRDEGLASVSVTHGDGMALPFDDEAFDAGFSMFGLMFFPDRDAGFRELRRVLVPGARAVISSWVPFERLEMFTTIFSTLTALTAGPGGAPPARPAALSTPSACIEEMTAAGFREVVVHEQTTHVDYASTSAMVDSVVRTNAPVKLMQSQLGDAWPSVERTWRDALEGRLGAGPQTVEMTALLTVGVV
jgi:SAM-dependent methyltransferase